MENGVPRVNRGCLDWYRDQTKDEEKGLELTVDRGEAGKIRRTLNDLLLNDKQLNREVSGKSES